MNQWWTEEVFVVVDNNYKIPLVRYHIVLVPLLHTGSLRIHYPIDFDIVVVDHMGML